MRRGEGSMRRTVVLAVLVVCACDSSVRGKGGPGDNVTPPGDTVALKPASAFFLQSSNGNGQHLAQSQRHAVVFDDAGSVRTYDRPPGQDGGLLSAEGDVIAYNKRSDEGHIYCQRLSDGVSTRATQRYGSVMHLESQHVLYSAYESSQYRAYLVACDGTGERQLTDTFYGAPVVVGHGRLVYTEGPRLMMATMSGAAPQELYSIADTDPTGTVPYSFIEGVLFAYVADAVLVIDFRGEAPPVVQSIANTSASNSAPVVASNYAGIIAWTQDGGALTLRVAGRADTVIHTTTGALEVQGFQGGVLAWSEAEAGVTQHYIARLAPTLDPTPIASDLIVGSFQFFADDPIGFMNRNENGVLRLYRANLATKTVTPAGPDWAYFVARRGDTVYFAPRFDNAATIWTEPADGSAPAVQLTGEAEGCFFNSANRVSTEAGKPLVVNCSRGVGLINGTQAPTIVTPVELAVADTYQNGLVEVLPGWFGMRAKLLDKPSYFGTYAMADRDGVYVLNEQRNVGSNPVYPFAVRDGRVFFGGPRVLGFFDTATHEVTNVVSAPALNVFTSPLGLGQTKVLFGRFEGTRATVELFDTADASLRTLATYEQGLAVFSPLQGTTTYDGVLAVGNDGTQVVFDANGVAHTLGVPAGVVVGSVGAMPGGYFAATQAGTGLILDATFTLTATLPTADATHDQILVSADPHVSNGRIYFGAGTGDPTYRSFIGSVTTAGTDFREEADGYLVSYHDGRLYYQTTGETMTLHVRDLASGVTTPLATATSFSARVFGDIMTVRNYGGAASELVVIDRSGPTDVVRRSEPGEMVLASTVDERTKRVLYAALTDGWDTLDLYLLDIATGERKAVFADSPNFFFGDFGFGADNTVVYAEADGQTSRVRVAPLP